MLHPTTRVRILWLLETPETLICFQESCFELEIADTPEKRTLGYMFRKQIPDNQAMLFVF